MLNRTEMLEELSVHPRSPILYPYPWELARLVVIKNSGSQSQQIPFDIPVIQLYDFSHPNKIPEEDCPFAIDGERYYFTKQVPRDASGNRSKRKAGELGAYWKSTSTDINITDLNGKLIGYMRKYTLYEDEADKRSANWYMEEYRVHNHLELVDPYVLCKIQEKGSACPGHTAGSVRSLTNRAIKRKRGSQPDQTNSKFDNMSPSNSNPKNPLQTQFDNNNSVEDPIMQQTLPTFENFPPNSLPIPMPNDASGNQNHPESIPWNSNLSQTQFDDNNFGEGLIMQQTLPTSESLTLDSIQPIPRPPDYSNGFSTSHDASGSQNPPESITQFACLYSDDFLHELDNSIDWTYIPHYASGILNAPAGEESPLDLWNNDWDSHYYLENLASMVS